MKINIIAVGKLESEFLKLFNKYSKRISFFSSLNVIEIKENQHKNVDLKIEKETKLILKSIPKNSKVILCSLEGKEYTSNEFSKFLEVDNLTFVIGGSNGVNESFFKNKIKFSTMTFPHQLFRVFLIEQLYRGFAIKKGIKYHK